MREPSYRQPGQEGDRVRAAVQEGFAARYAGPLRRDATGRQVLDGSGDDTVHVRAYERRGEDGAVHQVQAHQRGAASRAWESQPGLAGADRSHGNPQCAKSWVW